MRGFWILIIKLVLTAWTVSLRFTTRIGYLYSRLKPKEKMTYQDKDTFWHDKPSKDGNPSSNNGFIYTAYAKYLAPYTTDYTKVKARFDKCVKSLDPLRITRLPGQEEPPTSKDEIIGMVSLGLLSDYDLRSNYYNYCSLDVDFERKLSLKSFWRAVKSLWGIRKEHRNHVWQNNMVETYCLAYKLTPNHIYYVRRMAGKSAGVIPTVHFYLNALFTYFKGKRYSRMILWLKLQDLNHPLLRFVPKKQWVDGYFEVGHPLRDESKWLK